MMKQRALLLAGALAALGLAACGGNGYSYVAPTPGPTCSPGVAVQMLYPIPGATSVPDNPQQIVFAVASPLPASWDVVVNGADKLSGSEGTGTSFETITAAQIPSPSATPTIPNPVYQSVALPFGFSSGATIWVWVNNTYTSCTPLGPVGSFTTQ